MLELFEKNWLRTFIIPQMSSAILCTWTSPENQLFIPCYIHAKITTDLLATTGIFQFSIEDENSNIFFNKRSISALSPAKIYDVNIIPGISVNEAITTDIYIGINSFFPLLEDILKFEILTPGATDTLSDIVIVGLLADV